MVAATRLRLNDISRQRPYETDLDDELTPSHTVGHAVAHYLGKSRIPDNGLRWSAFSRGVRLDMKTTLRELPETDREWTVIPEIAAG